MFPTARACAYVLSAHVPATVAAKRFGIAAAGVWRAKRRRLPGMPKLAVAAGEELARC